MNLNYVGSLAESRMKFRSTTDVVVNNVNELFHAMSIYIPKRFAADNIQGWATLGLNNEGGDILLTPSRPVVLTCTVDNYTDFMQGNLMEQWQPVFRQDTNSSVILYLIVFDDSQTGQWDVKDKDISYAPLTAAFNALFAFSYFKFLFDPQSSGARVNIPASAGSPSRMTVVLSNTTRDGEAASMVLQLLNSTGQPVSLVAGQSWAWNDGSKQWSATVASARTLAAAGTATGINMADTGSTFADDASLVNGADISSWFTPALPAGVTAVVTNKVSGDGVSIPTSADIVFTNTGRALATILADTYAINSGSSGALNYALAVATNQNLAAGGTLDIPVMASSIGANNSPSFFTDGAELTSLFLPSLSGSGLKAFCTEPVQGMDADVGRPVTIPAGTYAYNSGLRQYPLVIASPGVTMQAGAVSNAAEIRALTNGNDANIGIGVLEPGAFVPPLPQGIQVRAITTSQGVAPVPSATDEESMYFDLSLAMAVLCRNNIALSWFWSLVKVSFLERMIPNPGDPCRLILEDRATQLAAFNTTDNDWSILSPMNPGSTRSRYYWSALYLLNCTNTCVITHSEPYNIIVDVLAKWFTRRNASGTFIGNKLSLMRLSGTRIKPFGWPSWLDNSVNENASSIMRGGTKEDLHQQLRDMNVGFLFTISDNTPQDSVLSMARGVGVPDGGIPVTMQAIAKFCDYTMSMLAANLIAADGTLTDPIMTNETAYGKIQSIVAGTLARFAGTEGRLYDVRLTFPDFAVAKVSRTALSAASAWSARYQDLLDKVEVSGGIIAE